MSDTLNPPNIPALLRSDGLPQAFAALGAVLARSPEPDRAGLRQTILDGLEATPAATQAALATREGLRTFLQGSPVYLRVKETRRDPEAPTIQERLSRLLIKALDPKPASERGSLVIAVLPDLAEISLICELFRMVEGNWAADHAARPPEETYFGASTAALRDMLFARVQLAAKKGTLWTQGSPTAILWFWWACGEEQRVYAFIKDAMGDAKALPALLDEIVYRVATPEEEYDVIPVRRWSKLIDFRALEQSAVNLSMNGTARDDRKKARRFLDAFGNGKSELYR
ncbi:hypothetical protein [Methyloferula stellata]|uniref:hypothetical protein n=1 Tax=Methyloferula stellata TaxID=876270 RepID=UPI00036CECF4|nr:hypothetical protein [Methyloferula stellata]